MPAAPAQRPGALADADLLPGCHKHTGWLAGDARLPGGQRGAVLSAWHPHARGVGHAGGHRWTVWPADTFTMVCLALRCMAKGTAAGPGSHARQLHGLPCPHAQVAHAVLSAIEGMGGGKAEAGQAARIGMNQLLEVSPPSCSQALALRLLAGPQLLSALGWQWAWAGCWHPTWPLSLPRLHSPPAAARPAGQPTQGCHQEADGDHCGAVAGQPPAGC